jgi:glyoxylase-like metal-dependent hydrolase (beta-lactamase superfamily II)
MDDLPGGIIQVPTCYPDLEDIPLYGYVVVGETRTALVDGLFPQAVKADLPAALAASELEVADIDLVVVTHGHPDHAGGLAALREANPDIEIWCGEEDVAWVEDHEAMFEDVFTASEAQFADPEAVRDYVLHGLMGPRVPVTGTLSAGERLDLGGTALLIAAAPGHTPGHVVVLDERSRSLFTGDATQGLGIPRVQAANTLPPLYDHLDDYRQTQLSLLDLSPSWLMPAHLDPLDEDAAVAYLHLSIEVTDVVTEAVTELLFAAGRTPLTLNQTAGRIGEALSRRYSRAYVGEVQLLTTARAHLTSLASAGLVSPSSDGTWSQT